MDINMMTKPMILIMRLLLLSVWSYHAIAGNHYPTHLLPEGLHWQSNDSAETWASPNVLKGGVYRTYIPSFPPTLRTVGPDSNNAFRSFLLDNQMQLITAMDDFEYTKWLDPEGVPCYVRDVVTK